MSADQTANLLYGLLMYGVACLLMGGFIALHG